MLVDKQKINTNELFISTVLFDSVINNMFRFPLFEL